MLFFLFCIINGRLSSFSSIQFAHPDLRENKDKEKKLTRTIKLRFFLDPKRNHAETP